MEMNYFGRIQCDKCTRVFTSVDAMTKHRQRHRKNGPGKHRCEVCPYSTDYSSHLRQHMFTHSGERPFKCTECSSGFFKKASLEKHFLKHSSKSTQPSFSPVLPAPKMFKCKLCNASFGKSKEYVKHKKSHKRQRFSCEICSKTFSKPESLAKHEKKHSQ